MMIGTIKKWCTTQYNNHHHHQCHYSSLDWVCACLPHSLICNVTKLCLNRKRCMQELDDVLSILYPSRVAHLQLTPHSHASLNHHLELKQLTNNSYPAPRITQPYSGGTLIERTMVTSINLRMI